MDLNIWKDQDSAKKGTRTTLAKNQFLGSPIIMKIDTNKTGNIPDRLLGFREPTAPSWIPCDASGLPTTAWSFDVTSHLPPGWGPNGIFSRFKKIFENHDLGLIWVDSSGRLSAPEGREKGRKWREGFVGARCRRSKVHNHARDVATVVRIIFNDDWRSRNRFWARVVPVPFFALSWSFA